MKPETTSLGNDGKVSQRKSATGTLAFPPQSGLAAKSET